MKVTILKNKLKNGVNLTERIIGKSLNLPILNNILISTQKNLLILSATDLELAIKWQGLAKIEKEGSVVVPAKILSTFINLLPEDKPIILESEGLDLKIKCENYQTVIKGNNPEDFPIIPLISNQEKIEIPISILCQGINSVVNLASPSSSKPEISGVYFVFQKNYLFLTATDSFRLGEKKIKINSNLTNYSFILPQRAAKEIINIFNEKENNLTIYLSSNQVLFETPSFEGSFPEIQFISRLIEGEYPNYQEIIPTKYETQVITSLSELINRIKIASVFSGKNNEIKLKVDSSKNQIKIFSQNPEIGEQENLLLGQVKGKSIEICFNHRFLLDGLINLSTLTSDKKTEVVFSLINSEKPAILKLKDDESYFYLVMPIKSF